MARFYGAIANGGKLVTPHILMDVENPNGTIVPTAAPPAPKRVPGLDPGVLRIVKQGLFMGTQDSLGTSYGVFGNFPVPIAGKTGTAQKAIDVPGYTGEADQSWWCGYGPANDAKIVVCAVIENVRRRRGGGGAGRRAGLREVLQRPADATGIHPLRLMLEYAGSQRAGLRAEREAPHLLAVVRSIDWVLLVGVAGLVAVGLWGVAGVTKFAIPSDPSYYLNRQILYA